MIKTSTKELSKAWFNMPGMLLRRRENKISVFMLIAAFIVFSIMPLGQGDIAVAGGVPTAFTVTAINANGTPGVDAGDSVALEFDGATGGEDILSGSFLTVSGGHSFGAGATSSWDATNMIYTITLGASPTIVKEDTISLAAASTLTDGNLNLVIQGGVPNIAMSGTFGEFIVPTTFTATAINSDSKPGVGAGDSIALQFDFATGHQNILAGNFLTVSNGHAFGTGATSSWDATNTIYTITLGTNPTVVTTDTISLAAGSNLTDAYNDPVIQGGKAGVDIGGTFGEIIAGAVPTYFAATAINTDNKPGIHQGDSIAISFNGTTGSEDILSGSFLTVSNFHNFGTGASGQWDSTKSIYTVILGANSTVAGTDTVTLLGNSPLTDGNGNLVMQGGFANVPINGTFGEVAAAKNIYAIAINTISNNNGLPGAQAGDKIVLIFDVLTNGADILNSLSVNNSHDFGTGKIGQWDSSKTMYTITLGTNPTISDSDQIILATDPNFKDDSELVPIFTDGYTIGIIKGTFGKAIEPRVASVTAYNTQGATKAVQNDQIRIVFDSLVNHSLFDTQAPNKFILNNSGILGSANVAYSWNDADNPVVSALTITLGVDPQVKPGDTISFVDYVQETPGVYVSNLIKDYTTNTMKLVGAYDLTIEGSFGIPVKPVILQANALSNGGILATAEQGEQILIIFNAPTNKPAINPNDIKVNDATNAMGTGATALWNNDGTILTVTLGANPTVKLMDTLKLGGLEIKDEYGSVDIDNTSVNITGSFGEDEAAPVVLSVVAADKDAQAGATKGDTITITFHTVTNVPTDLTSISALVGTGSSAVWTNAGKVLTITLGDNPAVYDRGYIVLNSLGIKGATASPKLVVGQYQITGSFGLAKTGPEVVKVSASSTDVSKTTIANGDKLTIRFNAATDQSGTVDKAAIDQIIALVDAGKSLGTNYTGVWNNNDTLTITIVDATGANVQAGDNIRVHGMKYASGLYDGSNATDQTVAITGSFDGREFALTQYSKDVSQGNIIVSTTIDKADLNYSGNSVIVFALYNNDTPVAINAVKMKVETTADIQSTFSGASGNKIKIFVFSKFESITALSPAILANTVILQ